MSYNQEQKLWHLENKEIESKLRCELVVDIAQTEEKTMFKKHSSWVKKCVFTFEKVQKSALGSYLKKIFTYRLQYDIYLAQVH